MGPGRVKPIGVRVVLMKTIGRPGIVSVVAVVALSAAPAIGQTPVGGQTALQNVNAGALAARAPGNMVIAGVARAREASNFFRAPIVITETSREMSAKAVFLVDAIEILLQQINTALFFFEDLLLRRAGFDSILPSFGAGGGDETPPDDTTNPDDGGRGGGRGGGR